jgi:hypothetical protein
MNNWMVANQNHVLNGIFISNDGQYTFFDKRQYLPH